MKLKTLLILLISMLSLSAFSQTGGGIKGVVVSRTTRATIDKVNIVLTPGDRTAVTNEQGEFLFETVAPGEYELHFETAEFEDLTLPVRVGKNMRELKVIMIPANRSQAMDDAIFAEFDTETMEDAQSLPTSLSASKDVFNNIASYQFSEMRFNVRGYDSQFSDVYMNGIQLNDAMTGYTPWSLWSGLNDATRNQEVTTGLQMGEMGIGGIGGVTNINTRPSQMRKGFRASLVNSNSMYRFRGMLTYASGVQDNGWSYAFSISTRQGNNAYVNGVYYNAFGYFAAVEKQFNAQHRLSLTLLGAPTERGAQQASTQEAYDLVGNNYYNPNWGWQAGKRRNARVRDYHEPLALLNYTFDITDRTQLNLATSLRFGKNGYSALTWYGGPDPRPDYYRYLPSYYQGTTTGAWLEEAWLSNTDNIRHINWDNLYMINRNQPVNPNYGDGHRSINMVEERHTDQMDWNFYTQFSHLFKNNSKLNGGMNIRRNRTEYYSKVKDLLGGDYWVDIDKFAERDLGIDIISYQNNMDYYEKYGKAPIVREGDKYSYDYYGNVFNTRGWLQYDFNLLHNLQVKLGGEIGYAFLWRDGIWKKGLFMDNSQGNSQTLNYLTYKAKANFRYVLSSAHNFEANIIYMQDAPSFQSAFVSPRTRNDVTPGVEAEKIFGVDASYNLRIGDFKAGALSWGQYTYSNNPNYVQIQDNSAAIINQGKVYWKNKRVESTPQTAANIGLSYRSRNNWFLSLDMNYYNNMYLSMSPLYRTDAVLTKPMLENPEMLNAIRGQEKFDAAYVMNTSIGKNWYINRAYTLGFSLSVDNLLNNQGIKTGGYEQIRLLKNKEESTLTYEPFDAKYFYMFGTNYYLNVYFRF